LHDDGRNRLPETGSTGAITRDRYPQHSKLSASVSKANSLTGLPIGVAELVEGADMLELLFILVFLAATAWIAARAFQNPKGAYLRSLTGLLLSVLAAAAIWELVSPSAAAGFGAFVLFCIVVALSAFVAIVACIAASVRHVLNAFAHRRRS
jgi:hypothetical protein